MKKIISRIKWSVLGMILPMMAMAAVNNVSTTGATDLMTTINNVLNTVVGLAGLVAVIMIIYGAFLKMTSAGEEEKGSKGAKYMTNGVIGLIIVIVAGALVNYVISTVK